MAGATDDAQLMARYATGDVAAFESLYTRHKGPLYRYFFRQFANPDTADELFQGTWVRVIKAREHGEAKSGFTINLYQTAHQGLAEHFRQAGVSLTDDPASAASSRGVATAEAIPEEIDPAFASARWSLVDWENGPQDAESDPGTASSGEQRVASLRAAIDALPPAQREVFLLRVEAALSVADIATVIGHTSRDYAELEALLDRQSALATDYANLERVVPPASLDEKVLATAKAAAKQPALRTGPPTAPVPPAPAAGAGLADDSIPAERRKRPRAPKPALDDDDAPVSRRPRWPVVVAVTAVVVAGAGLVLYMNSPEGTSGSPLRSALFAKRVRERSEADKAAAAASAQQDAEVIELDRAPLPPPPVFEPEGPQVRDMDAAIALIRKELVLVNQTAAVAEEAAGRNKQSGNVADTTTGAAPAPPASVVQPRERRLTKILEMYDDGNPDLAADSLEIFLRDFEDDPISQRILAIKP